MTNFIEITLRKGTVTVYADCRVLVFDPLLASEPAYDLNLHAPTLLQSDFDDKQWESLTWKERAISWRGELIILGRKNERLEEWLRLTFVMLLVVGMSIIGVLLQ